MTSPIINELLQGTTALRALARELVGDGFADDIVQETAIQTMARPLKRSGPAGGWLASVVRNLASKHRCAERTRHRHEAQAARAEVAPPDRSAEDADTLRRLTEMVTSLPEPYRGTILARYLREQTPSEIATATNTELSTVKTRLQRGLVLLRQRLDERGGDWRALLAGAFALDPTVASKGPTLIGTPMKLALFAAVLLPVGFAIWNNVQDSARTPTESTMASRGPAMEARAPNPEAAIGRSSVSNTDPRARSNQKAPNREAAAPGFVRNSGDPIEPDASHAAAPDRDLPAAVNPLRHEGAEPPADPPLMRLDVVGPAAFRAAFLPTKLGGLFASEEGERLWRPLLAPVERIWRQWDGRRDDFKATRQRVLEYAGRIRVLWMVQPGEENERDRVSGVFALDTDGSTNLAALAGDLSRALRAVMPDEPTERSVGKHKLRLLGDTGSGFVTMPMLIGGCLVGFFGEAASLDKTVPRCLRALAMDVEKPSAPLSLHVDLTQLQGLSGIRTEPTLVKLFGLKNLRSFHATVRPNGPHAELELEVEFGDGDRGVLAAFFPAVDTLPKMLNRVPAKATPWLTVPFRPDVMFRAGLAAAADGKAGGIEAVRKEMHDELGLNLDTELLDHLRGEVMVLGDLWQSDDAEVFRRGDDPPLSACIAWSVKDAAAFGKGFDKLLKHLKGVVHRFDTREVDGVKITRVGSMFLTGMHMAVGQDLFAIAFGKEGVAQLETLVAGRQKAAARPLPAAVQRVRHLAPAGWNGLGLANVSALVGGQVTLVLEMLDGALPRKMRFGFSVDATQKRLDRLLPLVAKHELENLVTMTGHDDGRWRLRLLW